MNASAPEGPPPTYAPPAAGLAASGPPGYSTFQDRGPPAPQMPCHTTVVVNQPLICVVGFRDVPVNIVCPHCKTRVCTTTEFEVGGRTFLWCGILFFLGWWPCCLIPFCLEGTKDVVHSCPNCNKIVGKYKRL